MAIVTAQDKHLSVEDSIYFSEPYPYVLPIMGAKVHSVKIRPPLPFGVMVNALAGYQKLALDNMAVGFGNYTNAGSPTMIDISDFVVFDETKAQTSTYNVRLDAWVLPFLNVYGIVGKTKKADININLEKPFPLSVSTEVTGTYVGYGAMLAGAVGPVFVSLDGNQTYSYNPRLDKPAKISLAGLRTGPVFKFNSKPEMNVSFWVGAMYNHFNGDTEGSIGALDLAPDAPAHINEMQTSLDNWYNNLGTVDQIKYAIPYNLLEEGLTRLEDDVENGYINYAFTKAIEHPWNMVVGGQYQYNYHWQLRAEIQFLGDRTAGLFSLNYRFGIRGKNWFSK
ncbi:hypothetical protein Y10_00750 [Neptunitalea sp. Y10]|uniref:Uncharacterized protein n=2 Tax=Neptunitalea lumnitzerae TaxID=2965509 RepID=A0ABQ5MED0_9FLAO|nr:hypothetical protein Y10_00750 [Neptunitalea sp. Y10]